MLGLQSLMDETMSRIPIAVFALTLLVGCGPSTETELPVTTSYEPVTDVRQTMEWILDPATDVIWESAGTIISAEGRRELAPTTDEGWDRVRNAAAVVAETGNLLQMPGRAVGPDWIDYAQGLTAGGKRAIEAAEGRDADALFDAGGQLYRVCRGCHEQYMLPMVEDREDP